MPTLVLAGRTDEMAERPEVLADALPNATLQLVDGDHATSIASAEFSAAIVEFLRVVARRSKRPCTRLELIRSRTARTTRGGANPATASRAPSHHRPSPPRARRAHRGSATRGPSRGVRRPRPARVLRASHSSNGSRTATFGRVDLSARIQHGREAVRSALGRKRPGERPGFRQERRAPPPRRGLHLAVAAGRSSLPHDSLEDRPVVVHHHRRPPDEVVAVRLRPEDPWIEQIRPPPDDRDRATTNVDLLTHEARTDGSGAAR